jgi:hypothetical protein
MQPKHRRNKYAMRAQNQTIMMGMNTLSYLNSGIEYRRCAVTVSRNGVMWLSKNLYKGFVEVR